MSEAPLYMTVNFGPGRQLWPGTSTLAQKRGRARNLSILGELLVLGLLILGSGFRVEGSGFRVQGSGFWVQGSGFSVQGSGFMVQGLGFRV